MSLREWGDPVRVELDAAEVAEVRAQSRRWAAAMGLPGSPLTLRGERDHHLLSARYVTGFVTAGPLDLEVVPKFLDGFDVTAPGWRVALWNVLSIVEPSTTTHDPTVAARARADSFTDLLADGFLASVRRGSRRGVPRGYVAREVTSPVLRGRLDTRRATDLVLRPWELPCEVEELSEDVPVNRLLRWAAEQLAATVRSPQRARALAEWALSLPGVAPVAPALPAARRLTLGPQHGGLAPALRIAQVLLEGQTLHHGASSEELHGFLWDSEDVFERFCARLATQAGRRLGLGCVKRAVVLADGPKQLFSTPDLRFTRDGHTVLVLDAKYKVYPGAPKASDSYQVVAAGAVLDCAEVALVYPRAPGDDVDTHGWAVRGSGRPDRLSTLLLDLTVLAERAGERLLVDRLADFVAARTA